MLAFPTVSTLINGPVSPVMLPSEGVDVWSCSLEGGETVVKRCHDWLSEEEQVRAARFVRAEDQIRFTLAHGGLRFILGRYEIAEPAALRFRAGATGKPALLDRQGDPAGLRFNLSHSHGRMLVAVARGRDVGIDLEQIRDTLEPLKLAERFYTAQEYDSIAGRPTSDQALQFYRLWVAKEAFLKAQGTGIASLQQCEIHDASSSARASVRITRRSSLQEGWTVQWLRCGPGWQGAVSACGNDWPVRVCDAMSS
ncbi:MAG TPA: 4'-phosphopantetheinyl transferase superfamily protein [Nitrospira sp.]|nr:4'-phosphopantetheinyl transferase superfamily protein [Nitrospira sp.]